MFIKMIVTLLAALVCMSACITVVTSINPYTTGLWALICPPLGGVLWIAAALLLESGFKQRERLQMFTGTMAYQRLSGFARYHQLLKF